MKPIERVKVSKKLYDRDTNRDAVKHAIEEMERENEKEKVYEQQ